MLRRYPPADILPDHRLEYAGDTGTAHREKERVDLEEFLDSDLMRDVALHVYPTERYKSIVIRVYVHQNLDEDVTQNALIPFVLQRGCERWPTVESFREHLDNLYGTSWAVDVVKQGRRHLLVFDMEVPDPKYVPDSSDLLESALSAMGQVITRPLVRNGAFEEDYVQQEKEVMRERLESLVNDKVRYALKRCIEEMCRGESFAFQRYGRLEDLPGISPGSLLEHYYRVLAAARVDVYVVGNVAPDAVVNVLQQRMELPRGASAGRLESPGPFLRQPDEVRTVEEAMRVNQGKLCLGFRTNIAYDDRLAYGLLYYNGILGGFTHSKLFQNVREKASLAYYASSGLERTYGILYIHSGIEVENYRKALDIIRQQVDAMVRGEISDYELHCTREALLRQWLAAQDNPRDVIEQHMQACINGVAYSPETFLSGLQSVQLPDITEAAGKVALDTIYFLRGSNEGGNGK